MQTINCFIYALLAVFQKCLLCAYSSFWFPIPVTPSKSLICKTGIVYLLVSMCWAIAFSRFFRFLKIMILFEGVASARNSKLQVLAFFGQGGCDITHKSLSRVLVRSLSSSFPHFLWNFLIQNVRLFVVIYIQLNIAFWLGQASKSTCLNQCQPVKTFLPCFSMVK